MCVCLTDFQQSSDQPGTSPRQQGQSHSLIILTFLHNDPTHNSPFSVYCSLPPSICLTDAYHLTLSIYFFLDLMAPFDLILFASNSSVPFNPSTVLSFVDFTLVCFPPFLFPSLELGVCAPLPLPLNLCVCTRVLLNVSLWFFHFMLWIPVYVWTILLHNLCTCIAFIHSIWRRMILI